MSTTLGRADSGIHLTKDDRKESKALETGVESASEEAYMHSCKKRREPSWRHARCCAAVSCSLPMLGTPSNKTSESSFSNRSAFSHLEAESEPFEIIALKKLGHRAGQSWRAICKGPRCNHQTQCGSEKQLRTPRQACLKVA